MRWHGPTMSDASPRLRRNRDALQAAALALEQAGVESPTTEARIILAHVLGLPLTRLDLRLADSLEAQERYGALVAERATRQPLAYVLGETEFMGLTFRCDARALVPRPETELLVEAVARGASGGVILDIGTGTGCIGLSLAMLVPEARVVLTDVSAEALELAAENAERLAVRERVELLEGRDLEPVLAAGLAEGITCVVSNPPYIPPADVPNLPPEVAAHESPLAWRGEGEAGLGMYERLIPACAERLPNVRRAAFEVGLGQMAAVLGLCREAWPHFDWQSLKDLSGTARTALGQAI